MDELMSDDLALLREYAGNHSEQASAALVSRDIIGGRVGLDG